MRYPRVSVVIPARNEAATIERTIESVLAQAVPGELEVIVADGASTDGTRALVARIAAVDDRVHLVDNPAATTPAGLNAAITASRGDVIVRCDAHAELAPGYISRALELLAETGAANVGGVQVARGDTPWQAAVAAAQSTFLGVGDARYRLGGAPGPVDTVYLGVFRRDALDRVGLFDETLLRNQDYEMNWRLRQAGEIVYFHPDLQVPYRPRGSIRSLWAQYFDYGKWKARMLRRHPRSLRWRQLAAPLLVLGLVAAVVLAFTPWWMVGAVGVGAYVGALLAASLGLAAGRRSVVPLLLPVALIAMHVAWGVGFLLSPLLRR